MSKRKAIGLSLAVLCILILAGVYWQLRSENVDVEGWRALKADVKEQHGVIETMSFNSFTPRSSFIGFSLNRDFQIDDVLPVFEMVKEYVETPTVLADLQEWHKRKFKGDFSEVNIDFTYMDQSGDPISQCIFSSIVDKQGHFSTWRVDMNWESLGTYSSDGTIVKDMR